MTDKLSAILFYSAAAIGATLIWGTGGGNWPLAAGMGEALLLACLVGEAWDDGHRP